MKLIYTESAKTELQAFHEKAEKELGEAIKSKKYVFGDEDVEVTASDVRELSERFYFRTETRRHTLWRTQLILKVYSILGVLVALGGILYPWIRSFGDTTTLTIIGSGVVMSAASYLMLTLLRQKERIEHEQRMIEREMRKGTKMP